MMTKQWKRRLAGGLLAMVAVTLFGGTQIAAASGLGEAGLETLGITEAEYEATKDEAKAAYNAELVALGWISAEEAAEADADGDWVRIGRGQYYDGILDKDAFVADALGMTEAQLEAAEDASNDAKSAERVAEGRWTAEEAAAKQAVYEFQEGIDEDAVLAEALGISLSELNAARAANTGYDELLDELGLTADDVRTAERTIMEMLVQDAVDAGTLSAEHAEYALQGCGGKHGGRGGRRGQGQPENELTPAPIGDQL